MSRPQNSSNTAMVPGDHPLEPSHDPFNCSPVVKTKMGSAWTNDLGESFPAVPLYAVDCACGRREHKALTWTADKAKAHAKYERRLSVADAR